MHYTVAPVNLKLSINGIGVSRRSNVYVSSVRSNPKSELVFGSAKVKL